ncbi:MAG: hypothetical protein U0T73_10275 [Chitinophagales bacterium]
MKQLIIALLLLVTASSCKKLAFTKKQEGSFKANGTAYSANEDMMAAGYINSNTLHITIGGGPSSTYTAEVWVDLTKVNVEVPIANHAEGFVYYAGSAAPYYPVSGHYKITGHEEGNPATRYTEANFEFRAVNLYHTNDTVNITDGHFYVNNY